MSATTATRGAMPSVRAQVAALAVDESYSRSERFDLNTVTRENLAAASAAMRNALAPSVRRAAEETGHEYIIEAGEWRTNSHDLVMTMIVTRRS